MTKQEFSNELKKRGFSEIQVDKLLRVYENELSKMNENRFNMIVEGVSFLNKKKL